MNIFPPALNRFSPALVQGNSRSSKVSFHDKVYVLVQTIFTHMHTVFVLASV